MKRAFTKIIAGLCSIILSCSMITMTSYADDDIQVILDGTELSFDVPPQIIEGRTMVPMRAIFEALGYEVLWNEENQRIFAHSVAANLIVGLTIGSNKITTGDIYPSESPVTTLIDVPPQIIDGRTFVPVRAISEVSGYDIQWDEEKRQIVITTDIDYDYITPPYSIDTIQDTFDDISTNIEQINSFIKQGMYLEAIEECEQTAAWHKLSQSTN